MLSLFSRCNQRISSSIITLRTWGPSSFPAIDEESVLRGTDSEEDEEGIDAEEDVDAVAATIYAALSSWNWIGKSAWAQ